MNTFKEIIKIAKKINPFSKFIVKYGAVFIITLYTAAVVTYILAGRPVDYYLMTRLSSDLMQCVNPCIGVLVIGAILFEAASRRDKESSE